MNVHCLVWSCTRMISLFLYNYVHLGQLILELYVLWYGLRVWNKLFLRKMLWISSAYQREFVSGVPWSEASQFIMVIDSLQSFDWQPNASIDHLDFHYCCDVTIPNWISAIDSMFCMEWQLHPAVVWQMSTHRLIDSFECGWISKFAVIVCISYDVVSFQCWTVISD